MALGVFVQRGLHRMSLTPLMRDSVVNLIFDITDREASHTKSETNVVDSLYEGEDVSHHVYFVMTSCVMICSCNVRHDSLVERAA